MPAPERQGPGTGNPAQQALAGRVRDALPTGHDVRVVSVGKDGDLLVRIDPARHDELIGRPGARPALMGVDRPMGPGWITVDASGLDTDERLASWLDVALQHHAATARRNDRRGRSERRSAPG
ncbi:hypothetical protein [Kineococcus sp. G2]|uniref:hypothetical protein n=1 Tax=Kineococcus sp. G2 TaxID=3127484 RepID=UPI00301BDA41